MNTLLTRFHSKTFELAKQIESLAADINKLTGKPVAEIINGAISRSQTNLNSSTIDELQTMKREAMKGASTMIEAPKPSPIPTPEEILQLSLVADTITDLVGSFLEYDRIEDEELPRGTIESLMERGLLTQDAIVDSFSESLSSYLAKNLGEPINDV